MKGLRTVGVLIVITAFSALLNAQTNARLVARSGTVEVLRGSVWVQVLPNEPIYSGESIRTGSASAAAMEFGAGRIITLNERTDIALQDSNGSPTVQLTAGSMRVVSEGDIQISTKETTFESAEKPLDIEIGYLADKPNLTVLTGAMRAGAIVVRGADRTKRYSAGGSLRGYQGSFVCPTFNFYPYVIYGDPAAQNPPFPNPFPYRPPGTR